MIARIKNSKPARRKIDAATPARPRTLEPTGDRAVLIQRMWRTADAQVQEIENRLLNDSQEPPERERDACVLAVLAKTLRELSALDETKQRKQTAAPADDDAVPRDIDELRRSLASKLETTLGEPVQASLTRVRIWVNYPTKPDNVIID